MADPYLLPHPDIDNCASADLRVLRFPSLSTHPDKTLQNSSLSTPTYSTQFGFHPL